MAWHRLLMAGLLCWPMVAPRADGLVLQPVAINLSAGQSDTTVWIDNTGPAPVVIDAHAFQWRQVDGQEDLSPTTEVGLSPSHVLVPAGGRQRLRVVMLASVPDDRELSYRIIIDGVSPAALSPGSRFSLPMFVHGGALAPARLDVGLKALDSDSSTLSISNAGGRHAKLLDLAYRAPDGHVQTLAPDLAGYVLAGSHKDWVLAGPAEQFGEGQFEVRADGQPVVLRVAADPVKRPASSAAQGQPH